MGFTVHTLAVIMHLMFHLCMVTAKTFPQFSFLYSCLSFTVLIVLLAVKVIFYINFHRPVYILIFSKSKTRNKNISLDHL